MSYKKNEGCIYFDLKELLSKFTFIDKNNLAELQYYKSLYELYKSKYELVLNHNNKLQKYSTPIMAENTHSSDITGTADTDSNVDESLKQLLNYLTPEHSPFESSTSTSHSLLYCKSNNSELARVINSMDGWTDPHGNSLWAFILMTGLKKEYLLSFKNLSNICHIEEYLSNVIEKIINKVGAKKFVAIVSDNGSNIAAAHKIITNNYPI
ncbi:hypothetical protein RhiirA4_481036 [Rhizophagus irregularis]|uniref:DUF659 domain-containing protein n=1 Tax=Rhizophagus irregularis TaxID=588596 RepID=A0A2I1HIY7_9GLOM|nr:hypothetical protein RhiirA4_481036 [Rhizophagus irregularis]